MADVKLLESETAADFMVNLSKERLSELSGSPLHDPAKKFLKAEDKLLDMLRLSGYGKLEHKEN